MIKNLFFSFFIVLLPVFAFASDLEKIPDQVKSFELIDLPLDDLARVVSQRIPYNLVFPAELRNHLISYVQGSLSLYESDYLELIKASLKISGFDYEIKDKTIFVKQLNQGDLFPDNKNYHIFNLPSSEVDLKPFLSDYATYVQFGKTAFVYDSVEKIAYMKRFVSRLSWPDPLIIRVYPYFSLTPEFLEFLKDSKYSFFDNAHTHQLVVSASAKDHAVLSSILTQIDREAVPYQVEVLVMSLNREDLTNRGFGFLFSEGGFDFDLFASSVGYNSMADSVQSLSAFGSFLSSQSHAVIYSKPFFQLRAGEKTSFSVGKEVPFLTSVIDSTTGQTIRNVERHNVGLTIEAALFFDREHYSIQLHQVLSNLTETRLQQNQDVIVDKQELITRLSIQPGLVYSVGGLNDFKQSKSNSGPFKFMRGLNSNNAEKYQDLIIFLHMKPLSSLDTLPGLPLGTLDKVETLNDGEYWYLQN